MGKKQIRRDSPNLLKPLSTDPPVNESLPRPSEKQEKQELRSDARKLYEKDWLAPPGSEREKQFLRSWAKQDGLSPEERDQIHRWLDNANTYENRNALFWDST